MEGTILLVEDERAQRILYKIELEDEGYTVFVAANSAEALEIVKKNAPDLAILDIALAGEDGLELMGRILKLDDSIPIILHTAYGVWEDNWRGMVADDYVVKSSDLSKIKASVKKTLRKSKLDVRDS